MKPSFIISAAAGRDLDQILEYILIHDGPLRALRINDDFDRAFAKLARLPGIGHRHSAFQDKSLRVWRVYSWLVIYKPDTTPIEVVRILHGARHLPDIDL